jgi:radical SAM protein (TIGR01212 family)
VRSQVNTNPSLCPVVSRPWSNLCQCFPKHFLIGSTVMKRRYNDFSRYLRERFGCRVQKITIDAGFSCPNRDGRLSFSGCIYCDGHGSGTGAAAKGQSIADQIQRAKARLAVRYKARKFLAYFQAFTNTYASCETLQKRYDEALADPDIVGLAIGTRPDCVDEEKLDMIDRYSATNMIWVEYGLQSAHNRTLKRINRGHTYEDFVRGIHMTQGRNILICAHVILGLPGESRQDIMDTASALADLGIHGIKIHSLYVLDGTPLADLYRANGYTALDEDTYVDWVVAFLERLDPDIIIQRLTGDPSPGRLLTPAWTLQKQHVLSLIWKTLEDRDAWQGKRFRSAPGRVQNAVVRG